MKTRFAVVVSVAQSHVFAAFLMGLLGTAGHLAAAEEHKAEPKAKAEAKKESKPEAKAEAHGEAKKEGKPEGKPETKAEGKPEAKHEPKAEPAKHEAAAGEKADKPSALASEHGAQAPLARRPPVRLTRPTARVIASRPTAAPAAKAAAPAPIIVQVKQEPARVEAILHVVPYGPGPGVPAFAGSGYGATGQYTVAAYPMAGASPLSQPGSQQFESAPPNATPAEASYPAAPGYPAPPNALPTYAQSAYTSQAPIRNVLRAPKNALTNEGLVTLAQVGYDEDFILELMRQKNCRFDTSVEGLAYMATHGLTERIVKAALKADAEKELAAQLEARR